MWCDQHASLGIVHVVSAANNQPTKGGSFSSLYDSQYRTAGLVEMRDVQAGAMGRGDVLAICQYKHRCDPYVLAGFFLNAPETRFWHLRPTAVYRNVKQQSSEMKKIFTLASFVVIAVAMAPLKSSNIVIARHNDDLASMSYGMLPLEPKRPSILISQARFL